MSSTHVGSLKLVSPGLYGRDKGLEASVKKLAVAILLQALRDLLAPSKSGKENRRNWERWQKDALKWFFSEETAPGSFYWVCDILDIGSWRILEGLRIYQRRNREQLKGLVKKLSEFQIRPKSFSGN